MLRKKIIYLTLAVFLTGLFLPQTYVMPVIGASSSDYNQDTFWFHPWGSSGTHKGVDIFAKKETTLVSATYGIVLKAGDNSKGGNYVLILGPKWRLHYYAHLDSITTGTAQFVKSGTQIGTVGDSGNAFGKQPHLHYSILSLVPYPWHIDFSPHGWKKMFYLNPIQYLNKVG